MRLATKPPVPRSEKKRARAPGTRADSSGISRTRNTMFMGGHVPIAELAVPQRDVAGGGIPAHDLGFAQAAILRRARHAGICAVAGRAVKGR